MNIHCRIDVYIDGNYVTPENVDLVNGEPEYKIPSTHCEYCPRLPSVSNGANFQVRTRLTAASGDRLQWNHISHAHKWCSGLLLSIANCMAYSDLLNIQISSELCDENKYF